MQSDPESVHELFETFVNEGNLDLIIGLYEPKAVFIQRDGTVVSGVAEITEIIRGFLAVKPTMRISPPRKIDAGDIVVLISDWQMTGTSSDGLAMSDSGQTYDIVRRQPDGTWRVVVDNPRSTMITPRLEGRSP